MNKHLAQFLTPFGIVVLAVTGLNWLVSRIIPPELLSDKITEGNIFLAILTGGVLAFLAFMATKKVEMVGYAFLGSTVVKLIVGTLYLFPEIMNQHEKTIPYILHFFSLYFIYLIAETVIVFKYLNKS